MQAQGTAQKLSEQDKAYLSEIVRNTGLSPDNQLIHLLTELISEGASSKAIVKYLRAIAHRPLQSGTAAQPSTLTAGN